MQGVPPTRLDNLASLKIGRRIGPKRLMQQPLLNA